MSDQFYVWDDAMQPHKVSEVSHEEAEKVIAKAKEADAHMLKTPWREDEDIVRLVTLDEIYGPETDSES